MYKKLTNHYSLNKVLKYELKPVGATRENIDKKHLIASDEKIAESYKTIKRMIDEYHKLVIEDSLDNEKLSEDILKEYYDAYCNGNSDAAKEAQDKLRVEVAKLLSAHPKFSILFKADLVKKELPSIAQTEEEVEAVDTFGTFSTYLTNYHENRKKLYSAEDKHSTVAYRLVNENLPKHIQNVIIYEKLCEADTEINFLDSLNALEPYLGDIRLDETFSACGFNRLLTQSGIDTYNQIIGGVSTETAKIKGLNEIINEYNQKNPQGKIPKFTQLYKQMLSDRETKSFVVDKFESDDEVYEALKAGMKEADLCLDGGNKDSLAFESFYRDLGSYEKSGVHIKTDNLAALSMLLFGKWSVFRTLISDNYDKTYEGKKKPGTNAYENEKETALKKVKSYSIEELEHIINSNHEDVRNANIISTLRENAFDAKIGYVAAQNALIHALGSPSLHEKSLRKNAALVEAVKEYLDSIKNVQDTMRLLQGSDSSSDKDLRFYSDFDMVWDSFLPFNSLYNKVRNYITSKPYSKDKLKLNFESASLLSGWDINKENSNLGVLFHKDGNYYLGIIDKHEKVSFRDVTCEEDEVAYDKFDYKLLPGANKMLPKVFFSTKGLEKYAPSEEILNIYETGTFKKGKTFSLEDCHKLIDFFKDSIAIHEEWSKFGFVFSQTENYNDIGEFYREVEAQGYMLTKRRIPETFIDELVEKGQLYLFQIYSKDFSPYAKGNLDLQTIYFKMLFDDRNLSGDTVYKLNGNAEIFYRSPSLKLSETAIHKKGSVLTSKNPLNPVKEKIAKWDIIKDKRYTQEKFLFHVGITLNHASKNTNNINYVVNEHIRNMDDYNIIGINRGERNLVFATVINSKGEIVDSQQISLNTITSTFNDGIDKQVVDYKHLLDRKARERDEERKSWAPIEQIKDIKSGYLSQAIHVITELAVKYNAFIAIENLDTDFIRSRQKIEKQIYQNFEKTLITKLNYLVTDKSRELLDVEKSGGALAAYQLTNPFVSFQKLGTQNGVLFRVPTYYVSNMDPTTGFVNFIYPFYETIEKSKQFFSRFESIRYNADKDYFEFKVNLANFSTKAEDTKEEWTVCTYGKRILTFKNPDNQKLWETEEYYPTMKMKELLDDCNIYYEDGKCVKSAILEKNGAVFFKELMEILKMTLQMRNTGIINGEEVDFLQSCVMNDKGEFFNSLLAPETLPRSTDANGAYNVARKALMMIERIKESKDGEKVKLGVNNTEWLQYAQK